MNQAPEGRKKLLEIAVGILHSVLLQKHRQLFLESFLQMMLGLISNAGNGVIESRNAGRYS
jgi:hypothetical protein